MATFKRLPNSKILGREYVGNGVYRKAVGKTLNECKAKLKKAVIEYHEQAAAPKITVYTAVKNFIESRSNILSPSTRRGYCSSLRNKFKDIAKIPLSELTQIELQNSVNIESGKSSPKTVRNIYGLVSTALSTYGINFKISYPPKIKKEVVIPTSERVQELFGQVENSEIEIPIKLAAMCGLRRSEICALQWADIDFKNKIISINKALVPDEIGDFVLKTTKSYSSTRIVGVPRPLFEVLQKKRGIGKIVTFSPAALTARFFKLQKNNPENRVGLHELRHYFASVMLSLGIPDKYAMKFIGHSSVAMLKHYQHSFTSKEALFAQKINAFFENESDPKSDPIPENVIK